MAEWAKKEAYFQEKIDELEKALEEAFSETAKSASVEVDSERLKKEIALQTEAVEGLKADLATRDEDMAKLTAEIEKYKRRGSGSGASTADTKALEEEIKNLKITAKELRRRLNRYETVDT